MTKDEKTELELQKAHAESRCKETYQTIGQIKGILSDYFKDYHRWRKRFEDADRALAMQEKLTKVPTPGKLVRKKETVVPLTKQQIIQIADVLGIKLELNFDDDEEVGEDEKEL